MPQTVPIIGIDPSELEWIRVLVWLLRHPDPVVPELTRHALLYLQQASPQGKSYDDEKNTKSRFHNVPIAAET